jgi:hypothetical protein
VNRESTLPKPFVFVLMPFDDKFSDIYKFGIRGAAEDVGAYAERIDEQIFTEGILDRIFNQISKSDVVVADMTGRNPNVFYEVEYAHALGKITLLLTQDVEDIPFDLKHRQHIVYGGKIDKLRSDLAERLRWAVEASRRERSPLRSERLALYVHNVEAVKPDSVTEIPAVTGRVAGRDFSISLQLRNDSAEVLNPITHIYLLSTSHASLVPTREKSVSFAPSYLPSNMAFAATVSPVPVLSSTPLEPLSAGLLDRVGDFDAQFRLPISFPAMPAGAVEVVNADFQFRSGMTESDDQFRLRLFSSTGFHEFDFRLRITLQPKGDSKVADRAST